ncbi:MAG: RNA polymerase sigma factor, partial [Dehalococcoidia bacterium]
MDAPHREEVASLLERALSGDKDAFGQIAEDHRDALLRLCYKMTGSREEAARAIGASVASVKTELHRGRKAMTEVFEHRCALVDQKNE